MKDVRRKRNAQTAVCRFQEDIHTAEIAKRRSGRCRKQSMQRKDGYVYASGAERTQKGKHTALSALLLRERNKGCVTGIKRMMNAGICI